MKHRIYLSAIILLSFIHASCTKDPPLHYHNNNTTPSYRYAPEVPVETNQVWGVMYVYRTGPHNTASGYKYMEQGWAWFYDSTHTTYLGMSTITFNRVGPYTRCYWPSGYPYPIYPVGLYESENIGSNGPCSTYNMDDSVAWVAIRDSSNINIHYTHVGSFPAFKGTLPSSVQIQSGLDIIIDSTTAPGCDSVEVQITGNNTEFIIKKRFAAKGSVNIPMDGFSSATNINVALLPFAISVQNYNGKAYAFIKQTKITASIQLLH